MGRLFARLCILVAMLCVSCASELDSPASNTVEDTAIPPTVTPLSVPSPTSLTTLDGCESGNPGGFGDPWTLGDSDDTVSQTGVINISVTQSARCTTVTISFGTASGPSDEFPGGIEVVASPAETRLLLPDRIDLLAVSPASRAFWENGAAVPVIDGPEQYLLIRDGSGAGPIVDTRTNPAQLILGYPSVDTTEVVTLADTFIIDALSEVRPGRVRAQGWGAAFEGHATANIVDANGAWYPDGWWAEGGTSTIGASIRMGNPGVAWAPFSFDIVGLPAGEYGLHLDSCGGQCERVLTTETLEFTVSESQPVESLLDPGALGMRSQHAMEVLPSGHVMVWGGLHSDGLSYTEYVDGATYDPTTMSWQPMSPDPNAAFERGSDTHSAVVEGEVILFRGTAGWAWNWRNDTWRVLQPAPAPVSGLAWHEGQLYATGADGSYEPTTDRWTDQPSMQSRDASHAEIIGSGQGLFVVRGSGATVMVSWLDSGETWTSQASGLAGWFSAVWNDGHLIIANDRGKVRTFAPQTNSWNDHSVLPQRITGGNPQLWVVGDQLISTSAFAIATWDGTTWESAPRYRIDGTSRADTTRLWTYGILNDQSAFAEFAAS